MSGKIEQRLKELGLELPPFRPVPAEFNFIGAVQAGALIYLAGHGPTLPDGSLAFKGKVGKEVSLEEGYQAARLTGLNLLTTLQNKLGDLDRVVKLVKVLGMVNAVDGFGQQPQVINGASDLFVEIFGEEIGKHARSAVGMGGLPFNMPVEIELIVLKKEERN